MGPWMVKRYTSRRSFGRKDEHIQVLTTKKEKNKEYHLKGFDNSSNVLEKQQILQSKFELK